MKDTPRCPGLECGQLTFVKISLWNFHLGITYCEVSNSLTAPRFILFCILFELLSERMDILQQKTRKYLKALSNWRSSHPPPSSPRPVEKSPFEKWIGFSPWKRTILIFTSYPKNFKREECFKNFPQTEITVNYSQTL